MATTVFVGMSGGVDSSVSAALLKQQGYVVVGVYMKNWTQDVAGVACPWRQDLADARAAAAAIDMPFRVLDFQTEYKQQVVDVMVAEYQAGRTPNPDVLCNQHIKFKLFYEAARQAGADMIATGHYAQVNDGQLLTAADAAKDQTYFLYRITEESLRHTIFPLGGLTKPEVRQMATQLKLPNAAKPDSQGICFVGEVGLREFLQQYLPVAPGPVVERATGATLGQHEGAVFYTIGQRHGLGIGGGRPFYVIGKDLPTNTVFVTADPADLSLESAEFVVGQLNWINGVEPQPGHHYQVRIRHRGALVPATMSQTTPGRFTVKLSHPERAVTAGQSAVVYDGPHVLGGGIVESVTPSR